MDAAVETFHKLQTRAQEIRDPETGWLDVDGCDAMIWSGKYAAVRYTTGVDIESAQIEPGKWSRRPLPPCWSSDGGDVGSKTTWSRDMFIAGLGPWAWRTNRLDVLQDHATYGKAHNWQMGEPVADGRTIYTPSLIGILYQMIFYMGGEDSVNRVWPSIYVKGLTDYQAHLQVMDIWVRGEIGELVGDADAVPANPPEGSEVVELTRNDGGLALNEGETDKPLEGLRLTSGDLRLLNVSEAMYLRLEEHSAREPNCWTYQAMLGIYSGSFGKLMDLVEADAFDCSYARCGDKAEHCETAEKLWALDLALRRLKPNF